jgi:DNA-binding NtrC family response regulator
MINSILVVDDNEQVLGMMYDLLTLHDKLTPREFNLPALDSIDAIDALKNAVFQLIMVRYELIFLLNQGIFLGEKNKKMFPQMPVLMIHDSFYDDPMYGDSKDFYSLALPFLANHLQQLIKRIFIESSIEFENKNLKSKLGQLQSENKRLPN